MKTLWRATPTGLALALTLTLVPSVFARDHYRYRPDSESPVIRAGARDLSVLIPEGLGLRVKQSGLDFLLLSLPQIVPTNPIVQHFDRLIVDSGVVDFPWPIPDFYWRYGLDNLTITVPIEAHSLAADFHVPNSLQGTYNLNATATATAFVETAIPDAYADISATGASGNLTVGLAVQNGQIVIAYVDPFTLSLGSFDADLGVLEDILDFLGIDLDDILKGVVEDNAVSIIKEQVPPLLTELLNEFLDFHGSFEGFEYLAEPELLDVDDLGGGLYFKAAVDALTPSSCVVPQPEAPALPPNPHSLNKSHPSAFAATAADDVIRDALDAAWDSGLLCFTTDPIPAEVLNQAIPIFPPGSSLTVSVSSTTPPTGTLLTGQAAHAHVGLDNIHIVGSLSGVPRGGEFLEVDLDAGADAQVSLDPALSSVMMRLSGFTASNVEIRVNGDIFEITDEQVQQLLDTYILPLYNEQIGAIPLTTSVFTFQGFYFLLDEVVPMNDYLNLYLTAVTAPQFDTEPPSTYVDQAPPAVTNASKVSVLLGGVDDQTIDRLLRFSWSLDGAPEVPAAFRRLIELADLTEGVHTLTARAWDLSDNTDASPVSASFTVDRSAPVATVDSGPGEWLASTTADFTWSIQDNLAQPADLKSAFRLDDGSHPDWSEFGTSLSAHYLNLADGTYQFELRARDNATNESTASPMSFTVDTHAPETSIRFGPSGTIPIGDANFRFEATDNLSSIASLQFSYRVTGPAGVGNWSNWTTSPIARLLSLGVGNYLVDVKSRDLAGNIDASPAQRAFQVSANPPTPTRTPTKTRTPTRTPTPSGARVGHSSPTSLLSLGVLVLLLGAVSLARSSRRTRE